MLDKLAIKCSECQRFDGEKCTEKISDLSDPICLLRHIAAILMEDCEEDDEGSWR